jgi:hypothetical protein
MTNQRLDFLHVSDLLSWSLSRVHLYRLCSSSEQGTNVLDAHNTHTNYFTYLKQESVWEILRLQTRNLRSSSSDDVLSGIVMAVTLSGYWLGATFTWMKVWPILLSPVVMTPGGVVS